MISIIYISTILIILIYLVFITIYLYSLIYSGIIGAPYVKTDKNKYEILFKHANINNKSQVIEIGSGTGELSQYIERRYNCHVTGIERNGFLYLLSLLRKVIVRRKNLQFELKHALEYDYSRATHVYVYLLPALLRKIAPQLKKTCRKGTTIVSYGFCIDIFKHNLIHKQDIKPYPIYYYRL